MAKARDIFVGTTLGLAPGLSWGESRVRLSVLVHGTPATGLPAPNVGRAGVRGGELSVKAEGRLVLVREPGPELVDKGAWPRAGRQLSELSWKGGRGETCRTHRVRRVRVIKSRPRQPWRLSPLTKYM